jgi:hypothetical protein
MPLTIQYYKDYIQVTKFPLEDKNKLYVHLMTVFEEAAQDKAIAEMQIARSCVYLKRFDQAREILSKNFPALSAAKDPLGLQMILENFVRVLEQQYGKNLDAQENIRFDFAFGPYLAQKKAFFLAATHSQN